MDQTFIQWVVTQAGLGGIAAFAIWQMGRIAAQNDKHMDLLITTIQANAESNAKLAMAVEQLQNVVGNCNLANQIARKQG